MRLIDADKLEIQMFGLKRLDAFELEQHFHDEWWNAPYKTESESEK